MQASPNEFLLVQFSRQCQRPLGMGERYGHLRSIEPYLREIPCRFCHASLMLAALSYDKSLLEQFLRSCQVLADFSGLGRQAVQCSTFHHRLVQRSRQGQQLLVDALRLSELTAQLVCPPKLEIELGQVSTRNDRVLLPRRSQMLIRPPDRLPGVFILGSGITRSKRPHGCISGCDTQMSSGVRKSCG